MREHCLEIRTGAFDLSVAVAEEAARFGVCIRVVRPVVGPAASVSRDEEGDDGGDVVTSMAQHLARMCFAPQVPCFLSAGIC